MTEEFELIKEEDLDQTSELKEQKTLYEWRDLNEIDNFKVIQGTIKKYEIHFKGKVIRMDETEILDPKIFANKFFNEFKVALVIYKGIINDWSKLLNFWSMKFLLNTNDITELPITEEIKNVLTDKNLFNNITEKELDKKIVGEVESRKVIFLCAAGGRLVMNSQIASYNILVSDEAGVGKDYTTKSTLSIVPKDFYIYKSRISPTVFTYWHNHETEPDWTWDGKIFYNEDISESVLNSDVFKVMSSSGSSATIMVQGKIKDLEIIGKPVMITTTATSIPSPEIVRRNLVLNLDSSIDQTIAIMQRHAEFKIHGIVPEYDKKYIEAQKYLRRVNVKIPFANVIYKHFPSNNVIMRTNFPRFLDFIAASAAFHQYQRKTDEKNFIIAQAEDYEIARKCFLKVASNKYMIPLTINQKKILKIFEQNKNLKESANALHANHIKFLSLSNLINNLTNMVTYGIIETEAGEDRYGRSIELYSINKNYSSDETFNLPTYKDLFPEEQKTLFDEKCSDIKDVSDVSDVSGTKRPLNSDIFSKTDSNLQKLENIRNNNNNNNNNNNKSILDKKVLVEGEVTQ